MTQFKTIATTLAAALLLGLPASLVYADLTEAEIAAIKSQSGVRVFSSDGGFIGVSNGIRINGDRARLFLFPRKGSIFRRTGRDVVITTTTDQMSVRDGVVVLDTDTRSLRTQAYRPDTGPITILLLGR